MSYVLLLDLISLIILSEEHIMKLLIVYFSQFPFYFIPLLSSLFSNAPDHYCSLRVKDQVSHPHIAGKVLYILIFRILGTKLN